MDHSSPSARVAAVKLLQGVVEFEDGRAWNLVLANHSHLEQYFARLGLQLIVDESEGFAYLRQFAEVSLPAGYEAIPKLFRVTRLSFGQTLLSVILRDTLRRFEDEDTRDDRCVVDESDLLDQWKGFFGAQGDDVRLQRELQSCLRKLEDLGFVRPFGEEPPAWEVRRIIKARLTAEELERFQQQLLTAIERRGQNGVSTAS